MITDPTPTADPTGPEAEPDRQAPRLDQRGIALQTVIITVVMIAIAGAIAAVLFNAADEATDELENSSIAVNAYAAENEGQCTRSNGTWNQSGLPNSANGRILGQVIAAGRKNAQGNDFATASELNTAGWCQPNP